MWGEKYDAYYGARRDYPADSAGPYEGSGLCSPSEAGGEEGKEAGEAVMQSVALRQQDCVDSERTPWFMQMLVEMPSTPDPYVKVGDCESVWCVTREDGSCVVCGAAR